jgi:ABC-type Fe3+-hydroxamate transport system substrate-binding protein
MKLNKRFHNTTFALFFIILFAVLWGTAPVFSYPVEFLDAQGNKIIIKKRPSRVVSLVPSVTEIIFRIGAGDAVKAITYHSTYPPRHPKKRSSEDSFHLP